jgi:hypothetical protein
LSGYSDLVLSEPSLQSFWLFGEAAGATIADDAEGAIDGTIPAAPANSPILGIPSGIYADGDTCFSFDGDIAGTGNGDYIDCGANYQQAGAGLPAFSFEALVYPTLLDATQRRIVECADPSSNNKWFIAATSTQLFTARRDNAAVSDTLTALAATIVGAWSVILLTYDSATMRLFLNGLEVGNLASTRVITANSPNLKLGNTVTTTWNRTWAGNLAKLSMYNAALSPVIALAHAKAALASPSFKPKRMPLGV